MRLRRLWYALALFDNAGASLTIEIAGGCLIAPYLGMSLHRWTAVITGVLAGPSLGHWIGGRLGERGPRACHAWLAVIFALAAAASTTRNGDWPARRKRHASPAGPRYRC